MIYLHLCKNVVGRREPIRHEQCVDLVRFASRFARQSYTDHGQARARSM